MFWMLKMYSTQSPQLYTPAGRSLLQPPEVSKNKICYPCLLPFLTANPYLYLSCRGLSRKGSDLNLYGIEIKKATHLWTWRRKNRKRVFSCLLRADILTLDSEEEDREEAGVLIDCGTY